MKVLLFTLAACCMAAAGFSQQRRLSGTVSEKSSHSPLPGVTVRTGSQVATTDSSGRFSINATPDEPLIFSFLGMQTLTMKAPGSGQLSVSLEQSINDLNQVVVTGYQVQKKADLTGAVSAVNLTEIKDIPVGNPVKALQGRVPGVSITTDGAPSGGATVRIRGIGTLGNNDPLYVIDGIPTKRGMQELNPDDIASFQVLKDASSATIYGSRAANGVIIITTKRARKGFSRIDVNASTSLQYYTSRLKTLNAEQRGERYWRAAVNDKSDPNANQIYQFDWNKDFNNPVLNKVILPEYIDAAKTMKPANTYWYGEIDQPALIQSYSLALSNGGERGNSLFSVSYYDNKGIVDGTHTQKATARFNSDYSFWDGRLKVGENLSATYIKDVLIPINDVLFTALVQQPIVPVHTIDGGWGGPAPGMTDRQNPVRLIADNIQNKSHFYRVFGNAYADLTIIPNLHYRTSFGIDYDGVYQRTLRKSYVSGFLSDPSNLNNTSQTLEGNWIWQNTATYDLDLGKSRFNFLAGLEQIKYINQFFSGSRQGYALENIDYAYLDAGSTNKNNSGNGTGYTLMSFFGKINYAYDDKYLAAVTLRRDGSSRFGRQYRYGNFPAFSLGWRLSGEEFMKQVAFISDLKLRYGWGKTGNQEIANNAPFALYSAIYGTDPTFNADQGTAYDIGGAGTGQLPSGYALIQQSNDSLRWESTKESNFGIDFGLFDNKLSGSVDYFIKKTSDILIRPPYLAVIGEGGYRWLNGASMQNKGLEILLSYEGNITKELSFSVTGNFSNYKNKVTYLPDAVLTAYAGNGQDKTIVGHSINSVFGYVADGLFTSQKEVDDYGAQAGKGVGRIRFKDLNGDGEINDKDRDYISSGIPDFSYGLNVSLRYRSFDLSFFLQGVQGLDVYNNYKTYTDFSSIWPGTNWGSRTLDAWTPQNAGSSIPALSLVDRNNEGRTSSYFIENGSYLKLRNIQLGYDLKPLVKNSRIRAIRIFVQGSNLFTIKSKAYTATDPENPNYAYPIPAMGTIGVNLSL
ncbi:TonB-dependent receptor [Chitinophaga agrisoli]|uniref:TonB-dependent receptor n=1 Tax=Chitinophaga agrisoli TaxID=2607653 RepID=A0A5B2VXK4_9BACT|nr:TonB-dependent receptor [Chitinophaga agrisoli]KAA2242749.1 TonB-dependent receptor [Chitinophaga agrisoli]